MVHSTVCVYVPVEDVAWAKLNKHVQLDAYLVSNQSLHLVAIYLHVLVDSLGWLSRCVLLFVCFPQQLIELQNIDQFQFQAAKMTVNLPKNRFQDILPCM